LISRETYYFESCSLANRAMAFQACRLELEMRDEKVAALGRELEELAFGGAAEEEVAALRKAKHALERRAKEQEEELDELAGQVGLLEAAKVRLEMSLEQQRKESRREASQRDDELEEVRGNAQKKVRGMCAWKDKDCGFICTESVLKIPEK